MDSALAYLQLGWQVVPVLFRGKAPGWNGRPQPRWQELRIAPADLPRYFSSPSNVGVLLGEASGHLVDVDLDSAEAVELAPLLLPPTWTFGRPSKAKSHWIYFAQGVRTERFAAPGGGVLLELRGAGVQTVVPPSVHPSGELVSWSEDLDAAAAPTEIPGTSLRTRVAKLAAACLVARLANVDAAATWVAGGACPRIPTAAVERVRQWLGLCVPAPVQTPAPRRAVGDVFDRARRYLTKVPPAISGQAGHIHTLLVAEHVVRGFELEDGPAYELLAEWNLTCQPRWSEKELRHKLEQAREHGTTVEWGVHLRGGRRHAA